MWSLAPGADKGLSELSERHWWLWGLSLNAISPLLPSCWGFSFALGCGVSFFGEIQRLPVDGCSAASCHFGVLAGEEHASFYSAILPFSYHIMTFIFFLVAAFGLESALSGIILATTTFL